MLILGIMAFVLFFLGDINDAFVRSKLLKPCFAVGFILLAVATALSVKFTPGLRLLWCAPALMFGALLIKALFFSFPVKAAYADAGAEKETVSSGVYALCRHPGVIFFAGLYICLVPGLGLPALDCALYIALNVLLAWFEDAVVFPRCLEGYAAYKSRTPFIIPNRESIKNCLSGTDNVR